MIFVDTNVFIYAVGSSHPLKSPAEEFFRSARDSGTSLVTSVEVLQELLHVYRRTGRLQQLDDAMSLVTSDIAQVWPLEWADVDKARQLHDNYPGLATRDLCHLASCLNRGVETIMTFDQPLLAATLVPKYANLRPVT